MAGAHKTGPWRAAPAAQAHERPYAQIYARVGVATVVDAPVDRAGGLVGDEQRRTRPGCRPCSRSARPPKRPVEPRLWCRLATATAILGTYPESRRTFWHFRGERYSGANLFAILTPRGVKAVLFWRRVEQDRKRP